MEIWKDVAGYEGLYQVSNIGRVRSLKIPGRKGSSDRIFKQKYLPEGRERVCLRKDGKNRFTFVSRLIAQAFIPNPDNKPEVDHINCNVADNRIENLRWATRTENSVNMKPRRSLPKGVRLIKHLGTYQAYTQRNGRFIHLGNFKSVAEAAHVIETYNRRRYGEYYRIAA